MRSKEVRNLRQASRICFT